MLRKVTVLFTALLIATAIGPARFAAAEGNSNAGGEEAGTAATASPSPEITAASEEQTWRIRSPVPGQTEAAVRLSRAVEVFGRAACAKADQLLEKDISDRDFSLVLLRQEGASEAIEAKAPSGACASDRT